MVDGGKKIWGIFLWGINKWVPFNPLILQELVVYRRND